MFANRSKSIMLCKTDDIQTAQMSFAVAKKKENENVKGFRTDDAVSNYKDV